MKYDGFQWGDEAWVACIPPKHLHPQQFLVQGEWESQVNDDAVVDGQTADCSNQLVHAGVFKALIGRKHQRILNTQRWEQRDMRTQKFINTPGQPFQGLVKTEKTAQEKKTDLNYCCNY